LLDRIGIRWRQIVPHGIIKPAMKGLPPTGRRNVRRATAPRARPAAQKGASVQIPAEGKPRHVTFALRAKGTLPEIITEADLETLNSGLRFLFARLREARRQFESEGDDGRAGAFTALAATWMFITLFKEPFAEDLQVPVLHLQQALALLQENVVLPILKPTRKSGSAVSSYVRTAVKGCAAGTVQRLLETGMSPGEAHQAVSKVLTDVGIRPERSGGKTTRTTVRHWCDEVASDVGRQGMAAVKYDTMFTRSEREKFLLLPNDSAKRYYALEKLAAYVQALLPGQTNPSNPPI
jgi:hypothetical protein